ncbi:MAG TPA: aminotransferase class I/II-fold pyridoxal phosphate-dependent enzyme [Armatimonadota bacterium]
MGEWEERFVAEAFATNWIAPVGPHVDAFERELAEYAGVEGAVALSSGTAALHLALRLMDVGPGDTVFCSSLTFVASANPILYQGAAPVFIDSEPETWNMSPRALSQAFRHADANGKLPKAVIVAHLYGQSADMAPILALCRQYDVPILEDAAEALGATYRGRACGTLGKFGIYSFNGNKIITTSGGGALVSSDCEALAKARFWATQARDPAPHYEHSEMGFNYRLSNVLAGIGRGQLRVLPDRVAARRVVFERYRMGLEDIGGIAFMPEASFGRSSRWLTVLTIDPRVCRVAPMDVVEALAQQNIEARPVWKPLHMQPLFDNAPYHQHSERRDVSRSLFTNGICLPSGSNLAPADQARVIGLLRECLTARQARVAVSAIGLLQRAEEGEEVSDVPNSTGQFAAV